ATSRQRTEVRRSYRRDRNGMEAHWRIRIGRRRSHDGRPSLASRSRDCTVLAGDGRVPQAISGSHRGLVGGSGRLKYRAEFHHEVRHLYLPPHAVNGIGMDAPDMTDDKNFSEFSAPDKKDIVDALVKLERSQQGATVIATFPSDEHGDPDRFPF